MKPPYARPVLCWRIRQMNRIGRSLTRWGTRLQRHASTVLDDAVDAYKAGVEADHREARQREGVNEPAPQPSPTSTPQHVLAPGGLQQPADPAGGRTDGAAVTASSTGAETSDCPSLAPGDARTSADVTLSPSDQRALERPAAGAETLRWGALPDGEDGA